MARKVNANATEEHEVRVSLMVPASPAQVWALLESPVAWDQWLTTRAEFELREGARYTSTDGDAGVFRHVEPEKRLAFTWEQAKHEPGSIVDIALERIDDRHTRLTLTHAPLRTAERANELRSAWQNVLNVLMSAAEQSASSS